MATIVAAAGGGNWSATGTWTGAVVPTAADNVQLTSASGSVTIDVNAVCRSLDCTGYTNTLTHNASVTLSVGDATAGLSNIAMKLSSGMTFTFGSFSTSIISFVSTSATQQLLTTAGKTIPRWQFSGTGSSYLMQDAANISGQLIHTAGSLDTGNFSISAQAITSSGSTTRALTWGTSSVSITGTGGVFTFSGTGLTFSGASSTLLFVGASASARSIATNGVTMGTITYTVPGSTGGLAFTGVNTIGTLNFSDSTNARTLTLPASTTTTIINNFNVVGTAGKLMSVVSSTSGTTATLSKSSGTVSVDYVSLKDITATGGATYYAGANSTNVSNNTGWTFTAPPAVTKTQTAIARIANTVTKTQSAVSRIAVSRSKTQTAIARIAKSASKTQPAVSRIANTGIKTQSAISRVATTFTKTQGATARIVNAAVFTKTQAATARLANTRIKTQSATANVIQNVAQRRYATQRATAKVTATYFTPDTVAHTSSIYTSPRDPYLPVTAIAQRLFRFYKPRANGVTVLGTNGVFTVTEYPSQSAIEAADVVYLGGHTYRISGSEATGLTNAGFSVYTQ
jgi:hypothetical protein